MQSTNKYSSWCDICSACFLLKTDEWLENPAQGCKWAVQRPTEAGGSSEFQKEKEPVSEEMQLLMASYDLLYSTILNFTMHNFYFLIFFTEFFSFIY